MIFIVNFIEMSIDVNHPEFDHGTPAALVGATPPVALSNKMYL